MNVTAPSVVSNAAKVGPGARALTDEEIVARVRAGEVELFEVLMRRYNQRLYRVARAITHDDAEAEDVMQEAYVRAFAALGQFEGRAQWSTWVTRIAVNEALARIRRQKRFVSQEADEMSDEVQLGAPISSGGGAPRGPETSAAAREMEVFVERAVDELPDSYRTVFVLREVEELSTAETAACLDISEELVKVRLHRARLDLRRRLEARIGAATRELFGFEATRCDRVVAAVLARIAT
jgi:RNA polymerase sigma-70 factor (ECF subfamily)